jgi:cysteine-rich repeat protein
MINSTVSGNSSDADGGGLTSGTINLSNVTISGNRADFDGDNSGSGGGIAAGLVVNIKNSIVAGNLDDSPTDKSPDCTGELTSQGFNLVQNTTGCIFTMATGDLTGQDPLLGSLSGNGGLTKTHALQSGSPAIDMGNPAGCTDNNDSFIQGDQRGVKRHIDGNGDGTARCDIGAFELARCGDGSVDAILGEECEDGNTTSGDGCSSTCTNETPPACGDGILHFNEGCDDGNATSGDGCNSVCQKETDGGGGNGGDGGGCNLSPKSPFARPGVVILLLILVPLSLFMLKRKKIFLLFALSILVFSSIVQAATITVNTTTACGNQPCTTDADGQCSLGEAIVAANTNADVDGCVGSGAYGDDVIELASGATYTLTAIDNDAATTQGPNGLPQITSKITLNGNGSTLTRSGATEFRFLRLFDGGNLTINNLAMATGIGSGRGGAILAFGSGGLPLSLNNCLFTENMVKAAPGGFLADGGAVAFPDTNTLTVTNCTFVKNKADQNGENNAQVRGGALYIEGSTTTTITNSTFSENSAVGTSDPLKIGAGAIQLDMLGVSTLTNLTLVANSSAGTAANSAGAVTNTGTTINVKNSILAGNTAAGAAKNCGGTITSQGHNLSSDASCAFGGTGDQNSVAGTIVDATLSNNGGPTTTHTLPSGSPAIDLVADGSCTAPGGGALATDQRGFKRPADGDGNGTALCDAGAVEVGCGNQNVDAGEECDDGNLNNGDGCSATCQDEDGGGAAECGNNVVEGAEDCDDGNTVAGDGCSATCTNEVAPACGDDILQAGEECDDGNTTDGDGCSNCQDEGGGGCSLVLR